MNVTVISLSFASQVSSTRHFTFYAHHTGNCKLESIECRCSSVFSVPETKVQIEHERQPRLKAVGHKEKNTPKKN